MNLEDTKKMPGKQDHFFHGSIPMTHPTWGTLSSQRRDECLLEVEKGWKIRLVTKGTGFLF